MAPVAHAAGSRPATRSSSEERARRLLAMPLLVSGMASVQIGASLARDLFPVLGPLRTACVRVVLAAFVLLLITRPWRALARLRHDRHALRAMLAYGLTLGVMNIVFYAALARLPLGVTVAIEFLGPLTLAVAGSHRPLDLLWATLAASGLLLLLQPWQITAAHRLDPVGVALALAAGAAWALYILAGRRLGNRIPGAAATALGMSVAALLALPFGAAGLARVAASPTLLAVSFGMAMLSSALPYSIEMVAMRRMSMRGFSVLMSLEPALAALAGLVLLGEQLSWLRWLAIAGIVSASLGSAVAGEAKDKAAGAVPPPV